MHREYDRNRWPDAGSIRADLIIHRFREGVWKRVAFPEIKNRDIIAISDPELAGISSLKYRACGDVFVAKNENGDWTYGIETEPLEINLQLISPLAMTI